MRKKKKETKKIYDTTIIEKRKHWETFANLIKDQFWHGGEKYKLVGFDDREATDLICQIWEESGWDQLKWVLKTCMKYLFRFERFHREKDLLKIACYMYILWLKAGFHLNEKHDTDTKR